MPGFTHQRIMCRRRNTEDDSFALADTLGLGDAMLVNNGVYCIKPSVKVLAKKEGQPVITLNSFGEGRAMYLSSFRVSKESTRFLMRAILTLLDEEDKIQDYICSNLYTECAYYPDIDKLVVINNSDEVQNTVIKTANGEKEAVLEPFATQIF